MLLNLQINIWVFRQRINNVLDQQRIHFYKMCRTHDEPNWRASGGGQPEIEKTEMKSKQRWFCLLVVFSTLSTLAALVIYGIFHLPLVLRIMFFAFAIISVLMHCIDKCCPKKNALDTQTETRNGIRTGTGNGITGDLDEFMFYDSNIMQHTLSTSLHYHNCYDFITYLA